MGNRLRMQPDSAARRLEFNMGKFSDLEGGYAPPLLPINWLDWESDPHVKQMDEMMEGIYLRIILHLWKYDQFEFNYTRLAGDLRIKDPRRVRSWMEKYGHLFRCVQCEGVPIPRWDHAADLQQSCSYCAADLRKRCKCAASEAVFVQNLKLKNYKDTAISGSRRDTNKQINEINETRNIPPSFSSLQTETTIAVRKGFDPLNFSEGITSNKSEVDYTPVLVQKILRYHFKMKPSDFWAERVVSAVALANHIDTMHSQMLKDVGEDWELPAPKQKKTYTRGDPKCKRCHGAGLIVQRSTTNLDKFSVPCSDCKQHEQIKVNGEWVDA